MVACFVLRSRKSWLNTSFRSFLLSSPLPKVYYLIAMFGERLDGLTLLYVLGGAHKPLKDMLHLVTSLEPSPTIAPGQWILSFESAFFGSDG